MTDTESKKINIAIVGGGIGGLCVAIGLLQHPHIHVEIYEAAHHFSEIGAGVAFGPNAQKALQLISPQTEQAYLKLATHNMWKELKNTVFEYRYGQGERQGEIVAAPKNETGQASVHRAKFLEEFVALVPKDVCHFGKRLERIQDNGVGQGVELYFKDGTEVKADCVIGADGIHSSVRRYLLGADHPALEATFSGSVAYRALIPMDQAVEAIGERYAQNAQIWLGKGGNVTTYPIDFGKTLNIVATDSTFEKWDGAWVQKIDSEKFRESFAEWGETVQSIVKLLDNSTTMAWSIWDLPSAPYYWRGNVVMIGDAAHATSPYQGQGAGQAIEDAYVIESLFAHVDATSKIPFALQAYDRIRRPRAKRVVTTSREAAEIAALRFPGVGDDRDALKENLEWRMDWMWHRDIEGQSKQARLCFEELVAGRSID